MKKIRVLHLAGSHYEMGYQHGKRYRDDIRHFADERVKLSGDEKWSGRTLASAEVLELAEACLLEHRRYCPDLVEELQGMADATGLSLAELIVVNGFTDFIDTVYNAQSTPAAFAAPAGADNCTAFLVPNHQSSTQDALFGQTWDMHDTATPHVILIEGQPTGKPTFLAFTTVGCVGMIGMNSEGVAVGINNLLGADGQIGVTWPFVIRKMLEQTSAAAALAYLQGVPLAGAHNYQILDKTGVGFNVEAMSSHLHISELQDNAIVHTNHCTVPTTIAVERKRDEFSKASSEARLSQGQALLTKSHITVEDLMQLTRDDTICVTSKPPKFVETCGAAIMRPATLDFWAVWGLPSENDYEHFSLRA